MNYDRAKHRFEMKPIFLSLQTFTGQLTEMIFSFRQTFMANAQIAVYQTITMLHLSILKFENIYTASIYATSQLGQMTVNVNFLCQRFQKKIALLLFLIFICEKRATTNTKTDVSLPRLTVTQRNIKTEICSSCPLTYFLKISTEFSLRVLRNIVNFPTIFSLLTC